MEMVAAADLQVIDDIGWLRGFVVIVWDEERLVVDGALIFGMYCGLWRRERHDGMGMM